MKKPHQHFIPQTYLRKFAHTKSDKTYFVDGFNKLDNETIEDLSVKDICVEKHLYTLKHLEGDSKYNIENYFMEKIESKYNDVYRILVIEKKSIIEPAERMNILMATLSMYFRTPKFLNYFSNFSAKLITDIQANYNQASIEFLGINISLKDKSFDEIKKEIKEANRIDYVQTQINLFHKFLEYKMFDGLAVIELAGNGEFITCDNPVQIRNATSLNGFNLFDTSNSIYVPLDNKHALFIAPKFDGSIINQVFYTRDNFFQHIVLNNTLIKSAERWAFGTKTGISKFLKDEEEYNKPADPNHPIIKTFEDKLELLQTMLQLVEKGITNDNIELVLFLRDLPKHPLYNESIDFQDKYNQLKQMGLDI